MAQLPAVSISALVQPGQRKAALDLVGELEARGFAGVYCAGTRGFSLCHLIARTTTRIPFGTNIANIYSRHPVEMAEAAAFVHELAPGRFALGLGVAHAPFNAALGVKPGKPLGDMREYVARIRAATQFGPLPPVHLGALRPKMTALAGEIAEGAVFANVPLSAVPALLANLPGERRDGFYVGNTMRVCVSDDRAAALRAVRAGMMIYVGLPNYLGAWRSAGYAEEVAALERAAATGDRAAVEAALPEHFLEDIAIFGTAAEVRAGVERWHAAGVEPILGPLSAQGDTTGAFSDLTAAFA
jgi:alkanesulfonate monooxygenase SsuD/methylene tetrahydromethanopterin reductase-like flavin-dependent oxidoreductase (luciferase family)